MSTESGLKPSTFDPTALAVAVEALGDALQGLDAYERQARQAARASVREKARTGRLKPLRGLPTGPVTEPPPIEQIDRQALEARVAAWDFEDIDIPASPDKEPA